MTRTEEPPERGRSGLWLVAIVTSAVLLGLVLAAADWDVGIRIALGADGRLLVAGLLLLIAEGGFTAWRIRYLTPGLPRWRSCLRVTADYVVLLVALPARLGEVAAVLRFHRLLRLRVGAAAASIVVQRLYDLVVLCAVFTLGLAAIGTFGASPWMLAAALIVAAVLGAALWRFEPVLRSLSAAVWRLGRDRGRARIRPVLRTLLQARRWHAHVLGARPAIGVVAITLGKWGANLAGIVLLLHALHLPLTLGESVWLGAAYNFLAAIPLQTIGGLGIAESGLTGLLLLLGEPLEVAASASIVLRLAMLTVPLVFWAGVVGLSSLIPRATADGE